MLAGFALGLVLREIVPMSKYKPGDSLSIQKKIFKASRMDTPRAL